MLKEATFNVEAKVIAISESHLQRRSKNIGGSVMILFSSKYHPYEL